MFEDAIRYPWKGETNVETIAIGGILSLLGFLIVPMFFVYGYAVRVLRQVSLGDDETPPAFDDWGDLFVDGLKAFGITLVYSLVPTAVFALAVVSWIVPVTVAGGTDAPGAFGALGFLVGLAVLLVAVLVSIAFLYLLPAAIAAFARTGRLGAAFSPSDLRLIGTHGDYATGWIVAVGITVLANVVGGVVAATVIGGLLVPFIAFYGTVAAAYAIGAGVRDVPVVERDEDAATLDRSTA